MKLYGETKQEGYPTPDNPKEIKNERFIIINGNKIYIKPDRKIKRIYQELGRWYVEYEL